MNDTAIRDEVHNLATQVIEILMDKRTMYGSSNVGTMGLAGVAVRVSDKGNRLWGLAEQKGEADQEAITDTLRDIVGYGLIGLSLQEGTRW